MKVSEEPRTLTNKNLAGFVAGAIPLGLLTTVFSLKYVEFFFQELELLPLYFTVGQIIYAIVNAGNDPLMGQLTDQTDPKKWGSRRLIYIKYGAFLWAGAFLLVWWPWSFTNDLIIFLHFVISISVFDTMYSLLGLCHGAVLSEMTSDTDERSRAQFWAYLSSTIITISVLVIIGGMKPTSMRFRLFTIIAAIISTVGLLIMANWTTERPEFKKDTTGPLKQSLIRSLKTRSFLYFLGWNFFNILIFQLLLNFMFTYVFVLQRHVPMLTLPFLGHLSTETIALVFTFFLYLTLIFSGQFLCRKLRPKWGMWKTTLRFGMLRILGMVSFFLISWLIPPLAWMVWLGLASHFFFGGYLVYRYPLMYLSIDEDEVEHGKRREGMYLGINALFTKPAISAAAVLGTALLINIFHFKQGAGPGVQPELAFLGIKVLMLIVPALATAMSLIFIYFYPLHDERLQRLKENLAEVHKNKREEIDVEL